MKNRGMPNRPQHQQLIPHPGHQARRASCSLKAHTLHAPFRIDRRCCNLTSSRILKLPCATNCAYTRVTKVALPFQAGVIVPQAQQASVARRRRQDKTDAGSQRQVCQAHGRVVANARRSRRPRSQRGPLRVDSVRRPPLLQFRHGPSSHHRGGWPTQKSNKCDRADHSFSEGFGFGRTVVPGASGRPVDASGSISLTALSCGRRFVVIGGGAQHVAMQSKESRAHRP